MAVWILAFGVMVAVSFTQAQKTPGAEDPNSLANSRQADIAIVYHIGSETKPREVKRVIAPMLISILDNADIDGGAVRVALVNFGTRSSVIFSLNTYQRKTQVLDAMRRFISPRQRSSISDPSTAIKVLTSRIFQTVHGDRPNVPNLVIMVTDSPSYMDGDYLAKVEELKNSGVYIFTIGRDDADRTELARVASQPSSLYSIFFSRSVKDDMSLQIKTSLSRVVNALRANPSEPKQAPSVRPSGHSRSINVYHNPLHQMQYKCGADEMDLVFVIDSSTSVTEPNFDLIKDFLKFFLIPSDIDGDRVRVGIVIYSTRVKIQFQMSDYIGQKKEVYKAIDRIPFTAGSTNTYGGLRNMRTKMFTPETGDRPGVPNTCILITDGVSNIFSSKTIPEAELAKNEGIRMYVIGIGLTQKDEVSAIASKPLKDNLFTVDAFDDLMHLRELVFNSLKEGCGETTPAPTEAPTTTPTPVYSDTGYDVIFMLDGSASNKYFGWMLGFAANFASQMSIDNGVWRVGAMTFSSGGPSLTFNLNRYGWKRDVVQAIQNNMNNNPGGRPDLGQAFQYVRSNMFTAANGDRPNAINYVVVMTANEESSDQDATYAGAQALKDDLVGIYTVGFNLENTTELDTITTKYIDEHQWLINQENEMSELPGIVMYNMEEADPITLAPTTLAPTPVYSDTGYDVIFMLDGSANNKYFGWMLGFAANFASQMSIDNGVWRVGAMTFSSGGPSLTFNLNRYGWKRDVVQAIQNNMNNNPGGRPDLGQAFQYVRSNMFTAANGDRPNAINYVVVMTANEESADQDATYAGAQALKDDLVGIYTVGFNLEDTTELDTITTKYIREHQWLINQENEMSELPGMIIYNMEEADPITLAPSTLAPTPVYSETGYDVIFMFDGSANNTYFGWMLGFAANFASQMSIDDGVWRVGAMTYSSGGPSLTFNLNGYGWKRDVVQAIQNNMNNPGGRPDLGQAFQYVRSNMFTAANGDRPNAINYVVVMTANEESSDQDATYAGAQALKDDLVGIYTVGFNLEDTTELDTITTKYIDEHQWLINQENEMSELPGIIIYNMEEADPVTRAPSTLAPTPSPTPGTSETGYDIIFMFDGTVNDEYFSWMRQTAGLLFVTNLDAEEFRIGAMTFTDQPKLNFNLNDNQWQTDVMAALTTGPQNSPGGRPDLAGAFDFVRTNMLTESSGDRPRAQNFVVLLTASEDSVDSGAASSASETLQRVGDSGTVIFSVGFNLDNTRELDSVTTKPLDQFQFLVNEETGLYGLPGRISNILPMSGAKTLPQSTQAPTTVLIETTQTVNDKAGYDIILMFDGTVKNKYFSWMKSLANNLASQFDIDSGEYRVGAVTFTDNPTTVFNLNENDELSEVTDAFASKLKNSPGGRPDLARAFDFVRTNMLTESSGDRPRAQNFVVLMTASEDSVDSGTARSASEALQRVGDSGTGIFSVGFNLDNTFELDSVTTKPLDQFQFLINGRPGLRKVPRPLKTVITSDPVISVPDPINVSPTMGHRAYSPTGKDIVFMFDGTADDRHFSWMKQITKDFVSRNDIDSGEYRVGAMTYGDTPTLDFDLDEYGWQSDVVTGITNTSQNRPGGRPDLARAFDFVRTNMLTESSGDRPRAQNFVVLMTASEDSVDSGAARSASEALQRVGDSGTGIFSVGFNLDNTRELDAVTTKPLQDFRYLLNSPSGLMDAPGAIESVISKHPVISVPSPAPVSSTMKHRAYSPTGKDIVFMFDGTADDRHFSWMKQITKDFVSRNDIDSGEYRVGAMTYGDTPTLDFDLDEYGWQSDVVTGITNRPQNSPRGRSNLAAAFDFVRTNMLKESSGDRPRAQNFVVLMTASEDSVDSGAARSASEALQRVGDSGTGIFSVGFNLDNTRELDAVTTKPLQDFRYLVNSPSALMDAPGAIESAISKHPVISVPSPAPVSSTMKHRAYSPTGKDIVFMFDGTADDRHFSWMKQITKDFVSRNGIDSGEYRVGAITYGDTPTLDFDLDEYGWQSDVVTGITNRPQNSPGGRPDLARAFDFVRTNMLTESSGDRPRAQNFVVLMTASEDSVDSGAARSASEALQRVGDSGTGIFSVGFNLDNTRELDAVTTKPLQDFRYLVNSPSALMDAPGAIESAISKHPVISVPTSAPVSPTMKHRAYSPTGKDIVFMFDGTADDRHFSWMKQITKDFVSRNDIDSGEYRVGAMTYGDTPTLDFDLDEYGWQSDVVTGITNKPQNSPGGRPDLAGAFDFVRTNMLKESSGDRPRAQNFVVLMTASEDSVDSGAARSASEALQRVGDSGTGIFSVGFNLDNTRELDAVTTKPLQDFRYLLNSPSGLMTAPGAIEAAISKQKLSPSVQVTSPDWQGKCGGSDVIFMLDGTVDPQTYGLFKRFAKNFTQAMKPNGSSDEFRVGGMAFTQSPSKGFHLSERSPVESLDVLDSFNRPGGTPNLAQAIDIVNICMFTSENGDRPRADNYMIILTGSDACLSKIRAAGAAKRFQETGGRIFTVGVDLSNTGHLEAITSKPLDAYQYLVSSESDFSILPMAMKATMRKPPLVTSSSDYQLQQVHQAGSPQYTVTNRKGPIVVSLNLNFTLNNAP